MPHVDIPSGLPGITGLLDAFPEPGLPIRDVTQFILRGPNTLTEGERELIASVVCSGNECQFCSNAHITTAARYVGSVDTVRSVLQNPFNGAVSERVGHLMTIAGAVRNSGRDVTQEMMDNARAAGATDLEIHDTVLIAALFSYYNRYVDGMVTDLPGDQQYYEQLADRLTTNGYVRREAPNGTH